MAKRAEKPEAATLRLNIVMPAALDAELRATVFRLHGMKKGNLSAAYADAVRLWLAAQARPARADRVRLDQAAREGRAAQERHTREMTPGQRMEIAFKLSKYARAFE